MLNPYSKSEDAGHEGNKFFAECAKILGEKGYLVYTNVVGGQRTVPGSRELRCGVEDLYRIAGKIPLIVSLRSGILDVVAPTGVNMFSVCSHKFHYIWHNLEKWGTAGKVRNILYKEDAPGEAERLLTEFNGFLAELDM